MARGGYKLTTSSGARMSKTCTCKHAAMKQDTQPTVVLIPFPPHWRQWYSACVTLCIYVKEEQAKTGTKTEEGVLYVYAPTFPLVTLTNSKAFAMVFLLAVTSGEVTVQLASSYTIVLYIEERQETNLVWVGRSKSQRWLLDLLPVIILL